MKNSLIIFFILGFSFFCTGQKFVWTSAKIWNKCNLCDYTELLHFADDIHGVNCSWKTEKCDKLCENKGLIPVLVSFYNENGFSISLQNDLKNIYLIKKLNGNKINLFALGPIEKGFLTELTSEKYKLSFLRRRSVDFILFFPSAEKGDKVIIEGVLEIEITE